MSQDLWRDEPPTSSRSKSFLHRQSFSIEQGKWMIEEHQKRGWNASIISSTTAKEPSVALSKKGQRKIVLHYTTIGGYERYYCMLFDESIFIPRHPSHKHKAL